MEENKNVALGLIAPWIDFYREVEELFKQDDEVMTKYDEATNEIKLFVENPLKADALMKILPCEKTFGNVTLKITVIPANMETDDPLILLERAFDGNPALTTTKTVATPLGTMRYAIFNKQIAQYYNDDIGDANGLRSVLMADLARDVLELPGVNVCTSPRVTFL